MSNKVIKLLAIAINQPTAADAAIYFENAYNLHQQEQQQSEINLNIEIGTINLEILSPADLAVKQLKRETL